ncbi:MAG: acyl-CoA dehydrogenase C-terminal domain-containing protein [Pseudomonadales bacterium]|nr:acyl-CoA dehydrogenase C-terminal domain-containing protein [Pseudomonadales bacterium]MCP5184346.1 acyl-CoA dehydrogenase C-terminal domain-containing protein [Pseudomonadales bacterium]
MDYQPPETDINFLLNRVFALGEEWARIPGLADFTPDLLSAVVTEAGKVASEVLAPVNQPGDEEGCRWDNGTVTTPAGFPAAFAAFRDGGWLGLSGNPAFDGQGMPKTLGCVVEEMFWAANPALYLYGTLSVGAALCIDSHGTPEQKAMYLPRLYAGTWTGTMCLTEPHAGTDLGIIRTRAEPKADGSYALTGTKIFITSGEHDLAENIVHLVLARLPDAPGGTRGISLFIVPKFLHDEAGNLGARNAAASGAIEHKMGIRGSATNVMNFDGATGYLIGAPNAGLACMFTMMNYERLSVGIQGLGASEAAWQAASRYAKDRLQGRAPTGPRNPDGAADPLLVHPDVRRMLLTIRAHVEAGRAFAILVGRELDRARHSGDRQAQAFSELLTPIAKAYLTDRGFEDAVTAQQVYGGHGYIREWGVEQLVRDARIAQIYEGTNGVQAMDLIGRKVLKDGGATLRAFFAQLESDPVDSEFAAAVADARDLLFRVTDDVARRSRDDGDLPGAVATDYLDLAALTLYAWLWARMSEAAKGTALETSKRLTAQFFFARLLPRAHSLAAGIGAASSAVMAMADADF